MVAQAQGPALRAIDGGRSEPAGVTEIDRERCFDMRLEANVVVNAIIQPDLVPDLRLMLDPVDLFSAAHQRVLEAVYRLDEAKRPIDTATVGAELRAAGRLPDVGGMAGLTSMLNEAVTGAKSHVFDHARRVRDLAVRRRVRDWGRQLAVRCEHTDEPTAEVIATGADRLGHLAGTLGGIEDNHRARAIADHLLSELEKLGRHQGEDGRPKGVRRSWGFRALDALTAGLHNELAVVGARPGTGKTSFATAIADKMASSGVGAFVASLETDRTTVILRMVCARAGIDFPSARVGALSAGDWARMTATAAELAALPLWIDDTALLTVRDLWARVRRVQLGLGREGKRLGAVFVDYVQLLRAPRGEMSRHEIVAENVRALKAMAQELGVAVVGLSQLNRASKARQDKRPKVTDLRESGEIEQCARTILLMNDASPKGVLEIEIAKQNNGPKGVIVRLGFDEAFMRFNDAPEDGVASAPSYQCGACGATMTAGTSCACGRTNTPASSSDDDDRDGAFADWVDRQTSAAQ